MFQRTLAMTGIVFLLCVGLAHAAPAKKKAHKHATRAPASVTAQNPHPASGPHEIEQELKITGQSRNLSMGLLFQKDKDKLSFGTPRTNYKDKITEKSSNF